MRGYMRREKEEIITNLSNAKKILEAQPELYELSRSEIFQRLDDGNQEMLYIRWVVLSYIFVATIEDFSYENLVLELSKLECGTLEHEYIGFVLQNEKDVSLSELLLYADELNLYVAIAPFLVNNIIYENESIIKIIDRLASIFNKHKQERDTYRLLRNYSELIVINNAEMMVLNHFLQEEEKYYDLLNNIGLELSKKDYKKANEIRLSIKEKNTKIANLLSIAFLHRSIWDDINVFQLEYPEYAKLAEEDEDYWTELIPVYIEFFLKSENSGVNKNTRIEVIKKLSGIANGTIKEKSIFISQMGFARDLPDDIDKILMKLCKENFEKDITILSSLDNILYYRVRGGQYKDLLDILLQIFTVNGFESDYRIFFDCLNRICSELCEHQQEISEFTIKNVADGSVSEFFFSIGLLDRIINVKQVNENVHKSTFSEAQLTAVLKGAVCFCFDQEKICHLAFQLIRLSEENMPSLTEVYKEFIFANYPGTAKKVAEEYENEESLNVVTLVKLTYSLYIDLSQKSELAYEVPDLKPSGERMRAYRKAQAEQMKRINQQADKKSVLLNIFPKRIMKYGTKNGYIQTNANDEWAYMENRYAEIKYEIEQPRLFISDPLLLSKMRIDCIKERKGRV